MQNNSTLLHEVTLKISTNDCFRISVTRAFSLLQWSAMQIGSIPTFRFMEWKCLGIRETLETGYVVTE